jgi:hypothetical protein
VRLCTRNRSPSRGADNPPVLARSRSSASAKTKRAESTRSSRSDFDSAPQRYKGGKPGSIQRVVGVAPADARDEVFGRGAGCGPAACCRHPRISAANAGSSGSGPERRHRAVIALLEHPPSGLALRAVLPDQHRGVTEHQTDERPPGLGRLRRRLDVEPAGLGEVDEDPPATREPDHQVLSAPAKPSRAALRSAPSGVGAKVFRLENPKKVRPRQCPIRQGCIETLGERLHLGELRHGRWPIRASVRAGIVHTGRPTPDTVAVSRDAGGKEGVG